MPPALDTRKAILDAAERLFADLGFDGASLRKITAKAGVNLAAAHYHFGSKEGLLRAALARRIGPLNEERLKLLDEAESDTGKKVLSIESVLAGASAAEHADGGLPLRHCAARGNCPSAFALLVSGRQLRNRAC